MSIIKYNRHVVKGALENKNPQSLLAGGLLVAVAFFLCRSKIHLA